MKVIEPDDDSRFFDHHFDGNITLITIRKEQLTDDENLEQLDRDLSVLVEARTPCRMVCDLKNVRFISSSGIGKLISLHRKLTRSNGQVVLCSLQPAVKESLGTSHLLQYFDVTTDSQQAVEKLK